MAERLRSQMGRAIREARAKLGISQHELARISTVARITIANVELGKHLSIRPSTAYKLAKALHIAASEIMPELATGGGHVPGPSVEDLLDSYAAIKAGTAVEPSGSERAWLKRMLGHWGAEPKPTHASVLFLLLARRHGQ